MDFFICSDVLEDSSSSD